MKSRILVENSTASCFKSQKKIIFNIFTVKMCEKCFVQTKTMPIEVNTLLWEKLHFEFYQFIFFKFQLKNWWWAGKQKRAGISNVVQSAYQQSVLFCFPPTTKIFFWKISENLITNRLEYKPESFIFKSILKVIA